MYDEGTMAGNFKKVPLFYVDFGGGKFSEMLWNFQNSKRVCTNQTNKAIRKIKDLKCWQSLALDTETHLNIQTLHEDKNDLDVLL